MAENSGVSFFYPLSPARSEGDVAFLRSVGDRCGFHTTGKVNAYVSTIVGALCDELGVSLAQLRAMSGDKS